MKPIPTAVHGALDYLTVATFLALPRALGWKRGPTRLLTGAAAGTLGYSLLTRYEWGAAKILPMPAHLALDGASGALLGAAPFLFLDADAGVTRALAGLGAYEIVAALLTRTRPAPAPREVAVAAAVTVDRPAADLYDCWRDVSHLPRFLRYVEDVCPTGDGRAHWVARAPAGKAIAWDTEFTAEEAGRRLAWRALPGAAVPHRAELRFAPAPAGRGTEVRLALDYTPPAGRVGAALARLFGELPEQALAGELRRFKQFAETGEVATTAGQTSGRAKR